MKIRVFLVMLLGLVGNCSSLRLEFVGSLRAVVQAKKINLRVVLEGEEAAVYADQLNFSIDGDAVILHKPIMLVQPALEFIPLNKSIKAIFQRAFDVEVSFDCQLTSPKEIFQELEKSKIFLSSLVLFKGGSAQSKTVFIEIKPKRKVKNWHDFFVDTAGRPVQNDEKQEDGYNWDEIGVFEQIESCWIGLGNKIYDFFASDLFLILYSLLLGVVFLLGILRILPFTSRFCFDASWKRELLQGVMLFEVMLSCKFIQFFCSRHYAFYALSGLFLVVGMFYVRSKYPAESTLSKVRITIGLILIGLVLPLLAKGWILSW